LYRPSWRIRSSHLRPSAKCQLVHLPSA
jgi:hypothetical protein